MTSTPQHPEQQEYTPTPWAIYRDHPESPGIAFIDALSVHRACYRGIEVATVYVAEPGTKGAADAELIVEAVNNHARLLAENAALRERVETLTKAGKSALKTLEEMNKEFNGWGGDGDLPEFIALRDALAGGKA